MELKEQTEIESILASLSEQAALHLEVIGYDLENLAELDFIFARAALAMDMNGSEPLFNTEGRIVLAEAHHASSIKRK